MPPKKKKKYENPKTEQTQSPSNEGSTTSEDTGSKSPLLSTFSEEDYNYSGQNDFFLFTPKELDADSSSATAAPSTPIRESSGIDNIFTPFSIHHPDEISSMYRTEFHIGTPAGFYSTFAIQDGTNLMEDLVPSSSSAATETAPSLLDHLYHHLTPLSDSGILDHLPSTAGFTDPNNQEEVLNTAARLYSYFENFEHSLGSTITPVLLFLAGLAIEQNSVF